MSEKSGSAAAVVTAKKPKTKTRPKTKECLGSAWLRFRPEAFARRLGLDILRKPPVRLDSMIVCDVNAARTQTSITLGYSLSAVHPIRLVYVTIQQVAGPASAKAPPGGQPLHVPEWSIDVHQTPCADLDLDDTTIPWSFMPNQTFKIEIDYSFDGTNFNTAGIVFVTSP